MSYIVNIKVDDSPSRIGSFR